MGGGGSVGGGACVLVGTGVSAGATVFVGSGVFVGAAVFVGTSVGTSVGDGGMVNVGAGVMVTNGVHVGIGVQVGGMKNGVLIGRNSCGGVGCSGGLNGVNVAVKKGVYVGNSVGMPVAPPSVGFGVTEGPPAFSGAYASSTAPRQ